MTWPVATPPVSGSTSRPALIAVTSAVADEARRASAHAAKDKRAGRGLIPPFLSLRGSQELRHVARDGGRGGQARRIDADEVHQARQAAVRLLGDHEIAEAVAGALELGPYAA